MPCAGHYFLTQHDLFDSTDIAQEDLDHLHQIPSDPRLYTGSFSKACGAHRYVQVFKNCARFALWFRYKNEYVNDGYQNEFIIHPERGMIEREPDKRMLGIENEVIVSLKWSLTHR